MRFSSSSVSCRKFLFKAFLGLCAVVCLAFHFTASACAQNTPASSKASDAAAAAAPAQDAAQIAGVEPDERVGAADDDQAASPAAAPGGRSGAL